MSQELDLKRAVKEFQAGIDTDRNGELISEFLQSFLWKYFRRNNLLKNECEDLIQETLLRVFRDIGAFRFESRLETWVFKIANTVLIRELRRNKAKKRFGVTVSIDGDDSEE